MSILGFMNNTKVSVIAELIMNHKLEMELDLMALYLT